MNGARGTRPAPVGPAAGVLALAVALAAGCNRAPEAPAPDETPVPAPAAGAAAPTGEPESAPADEPPPRVPPAPDLTGVEPRVARAIDTARGRVTSEPGSAAAWGELAATFDAHGMFGPATACYRRAAELAPEEFRWAYLLAVVRDVNGADADEISRLFGRATELDPDYVATWFRLGHALSLRGRLSESREALERALAVDPALAVAHRELGQVLLAEGRPRDALPHLERALELSPNDGSVHSALARVYAGLGDDDAAARAVEKARRLDPINDLRDPVYAREVAARGTSTRQVVELAERLLAAGDPRGALAVLQPLDRDPGTAGEMLIAQAFYLEGSAWRRLGDAARARAALERSLAIDARQVGAMIERAGLAEDAGRFDEARSGLLAALREAPDDPQALAALAQVQARSGDDPAAIATYERLAAAAQPDARALMNWGNALMRSGRIDDAIARYTEALRAEPGYANAHFNLGVVLERAGRRAEGLELYRAAVAIDPGHPARSAVRRLGGD